MAEKDPIRLNYDGDGNPDGFAEFQSADYIGISDGGTGGSYSSLADLRIGLGLQIGSDVQAYDADLTTLSNLTHSDGAFIVSDGTQWTVESGSTARDTLSLGTSDDVTFATLTTTGSVTIQGNLDVQGEFLNTTAEIVVIDDAFVKLNNGNGEVDSGIIIETSDTDDARLFYDVSTNRWVLGENQSYDEILTQDSTDTLTNKTLSGADNTFTNLPNSAFTNSSVTITDGTNSTTIALGDTITFTGGTGITLTEGSGTITGSVDFTEFDTDSVTEGSSNLYFTNARADGRIAVASIQDLSDVGFTSLASGDVLRYNGSSWINDPLNLGTDTEGDYVQNLVAGTGISVSATSGEAQTPTVAVVMSAFDTDDLAEGTTNLYYTTARWDTKMAAADTDDLSEGSTNLYYTDTRVGTYLTTNSYATESYVDSAVASENELSEMNDVTLTSTATGNILQYNGTAWVNIAPDTDDISEGTNLYFTTARIDSHLSGGTGITYSTGALSIDFTEFDTDDVVEGTTNLYFTNARSRGAVSVSDAGGDGSLSYDNTTGVFTYTGPSASEVRAHISVTDSGGDGSLAYNSSTGVITYTGPSASEVQAHFSAGTGVSYSSGEFSIGQAVGTADNVQFNNVQVDGTLTSDDITSTNISIAGNATITGNLTVSGTTTSVDSTTVTVNDPLFKYADGNTGNSVDIGFYGEYVQSSTTKYAGLVWDASQSDKFRLFHGVQTEPTSTLDITATGYTLGTLLANLEGNVTGNLTGNVTGTVSSLSNHDTDDLAEGTNLYFTTARIDSHLSGGTGISYSSGAIAIDFSEFNTGSITEGSNLFYTDERVQDAVGGQFVTNGTHTGISFTYDDAGDGAIDATVSLASFDTDNLSEGSTNLYYTDTRVGSYLTTNSYATQSYVDNAVAGENELSEMNDVSITSLVSNQFLQYNGTSWVNITIDTDDVAEGTNLYYTDTRFDTRLGTKTTDNLTEGSTNLYYTNARVESYLSGSTGIDFSSGAISIDSTVATLTGTQTFTNKTINFEDNTPIIEFAVTVANVSGNKYHLDGETTASIQLIPGITYRFDQSDSSNSGHPLVFSTTQDGTHNSGSAYTTGVTTNGSPGSSGAYTQIVVDAATADTLYYYCSSHSGMAGDSVVSVQGTSLSASDTDDLAEGSSNLYYTDTRARASVSVTDSGGDGSLSYNSSTGVFTYTGPSASEVRAHFSAGTGVTLSSGEISIGQAVSTSSNVTFNDLTVSGNLTVSGTTTTVNTETIELADNIIVFNSNATGSASENAGIEIERGDDANKTLIWDETNDRWTVGSESFVAGTFIGALTGNVTGTVSDISNHDTDDLSEGATNLYYTTARFDTAFGGKTTDNLSEGTTNLYYTDTRWDTRLSAKTTDNLTEGSTNLYYTDARADARISAASLGDLSDVTDNASSVGDILRYTGSAWSTSDELVGISKLNLLSTDAMLSSAYKDVVFRVNPTSAATGDFIDLSFQSDGNSTGIVDFARITVDAVNIDDNGGNAEGALKFKVASSAVLDEIAQITKDGILLRDGKTLTFEGATDDAFETTFAVTDPTADRTITFPNATGTVALTSDLPSVPSDTDGLSEGSTNLYFTNTRADDRADLRIAAANVNDLNDILFSDPTSSDDAKVISYSDSSGGFVLSSLSGLSGSGEVNTASNVNNAGVGVFKQKNGEDLEFRGINVGSAKLTITNDTANNEIDIDFGSVSIDDLSDVDTTTTAPTSGQALKWSGSAWVPGDASSQVANLTDVTLTSLASTNVLQYNGTAWVNVTLDTDDIGEGSTNLYYTTSRSNIDFDTRLSAKTTDNLTEGSTNLYFTNARVDTEIDSYVTGGTGVTVSSGEISIGQAVATTSDVTFNDLTVSGNLIVSGTTTTVNTETINLADNVILLNSNETGTPSQNGGIEVERGTETNKTFVWDESTDKWTVGSETIVASTFEGSATNISATAITDLTEDTSPAEGDFLVTYDVSASALKKVQKSNIAAAVSFSVNDELPLTLADNTSDPIQFTNVGTSATDLDLTLADGTENPIQIVATSNSATVFRDNDTDTYIKVEATTDDDTIRMATAGTERLVIESTGEVKANGVDVSKTGWILLSSNAVSGSSGTTVDGVFTSTYTNYKIIINITGSHTTTQAVRMVLRASGADDTNSNYSSGERTFRISSDNEFEGRNDATTFWNIGGFDGSQTDNAISRDITLYGPQTSRRTTFSGTGMTDEVTEQQFLYFGGTFENTTSFDGIKIYPSAGTWTGQINIYGWLD